MFIRELIDLSVQIKTLADIIIKKDLFFFLDKIIYEIPYYDIRVFTGQV